jgi:hypothetical protein
LGLIAIRWSNSRSFIMSGSPFFGSLMVLIYTILEYFGSEIKGNNLYSKKFIKTNFSRDLGIEIHLK